MKFLNLLILVAVIFTNACTSYSPNKKAEVKKKKNNDEQNEEYAKKSQEWLNQKSTIEKQNSRDNKMVVTGTRPEFDVDKEKVKMIQQKAAEGDADYQYSLGMCYKYGYGMPQDTNQALYWFKKAADQGHKQAAQVYNFMIKRK